MTDPAPVLIIDDHELVRSALVVALADRGLPAGGIGPAEVPALLRGPAPAGGLVLLDLDLGGGLDGARLVPRLRRAGWRVLVVTGSLDGSRIATAVTAGAAGWVAKTAPMDELVDQVVRAAQGRSLLDDAERSRLRAIAVEARREKEERDERWSRLTPRESEVARCLAAGMRPASIAARFVVSVNTVRTQIRSILVKLEVGSQLEAAAVARDRSDPTGSID